MSEDILICLFGWARGLLLLFTCWFPQLNCSSQKHISLRIVVDSRDHIQFVDLAGISRMVEKKSHVAASGRTELVLT